MEDKMKKITQIDIEKLFWAITYTRICDEWGIELIECDSARELDEVLGDASVEAGENPDTIFKIIGLYTTQEAHNYNVHYEEEALKNEQL